MAEMELSRCRTHLDDIMERISDDLESEHLMIKKPQGDSQIIKFFSGCNVLVTGGSGFMGKVLIEKLLRCCPGIVKLFILIRPKKGKSSQDRFYEIFDDYLFERLRREVPNYGDVVVMVESDMGKVGLGLSDENRQLLRTTNVVFHGAATVRFNDPIRSAAAINVRGVKEILQLAKQMNNLKAFVHISTAFSQCDQNIVHEKFYRPPIDPDELLQLLDILDDEAIELLSPKLRGNCPNNYTLTKAIGEDVIRKYGSGMPACVVRPSIVISTADEPTAGWTNNLYGATGVVVGSAYGILRTLNCNENNFAEIIPVDYVINTIIAAAWDVGHTWNARTIESDANSASDLEIPEEPTVYNSVSNDNPITWGHFLKENAREGYKTGVESSIWYFALTLDANVFVHKFKNLFLHLIPAIIIDGGLIALGKKPLLWTTYAKINKFSGVIAFFSSKGWKFSNDSVVKLWEKLSPVDQEIFYFNLKDLDWNVYIRSHLRGVRFYLMGEPVTTEERARIHYRRLKYLHYTVVISFRILMLWLLYKVIQYVFLRIFSLP